jgi:hypothetical protein
MAVSGGEQNRDSATVVAGISYVCKLFFGLLTSSSDLAALTFSNLSLCEQAADVSETRLTY